MSSRPNYAPLFPGLHAELMRLLRGLGADDWRRRTWAPEWTVRDVAAHMLDGDVRRLSLQRDQHQLAPPEGPIDSYGDLVDYLNALNADWVRAAARLSPRVLIDFLAVTGPQVSELLATLDPAGRALFGVAWADEEVSEHWLDIGREYTERWHHQQQIRDAVGAPALTDREWLRPVIEISMRALPRTYRDVVVPPDAAVTFEISGVSGGVWSLVRGADGWRLAVGEMAGAISRVAVDEDTAWKAFFRAVPRDELARGIRVSGDRRVGETFLDVAAVMV